MPCFTLVQVEVKDKVMAERALKKMGAKASIEKNANGTYTVTPAKQDASFRDTFMSEYAAQVATAKAQADGYTVTRQEVDGETVLYLRDYSS
jgi:hypothetical protein